MENERVLVGRMLRRYVAMPRAATQKEGGTHMKQQGANDIIGSANNTLSFTVLRRSVGA